MRTFTFNPSEIANPPQILIGYDSKTYSFSVMSVETQCGYFVPIDFVLGHYWRLSTLLSIILDGCTQPVEVLIDNDAEKEIELILETNIALF